MPRYAKHIEVRVVAGHETLLIDGDEFPWYVAAESVRLEVSATRPPGVAVLILADRVDVTHALADAPAEESQ